MFLRSEKKCGLRMTSRRGERTLFCDAPSSLGAAEGLCLLLRHFLRQANHSELRFAAELSLRECLNNAIAHGNRHDPGRRLRLSVAARRDGVSLTVSDNGEGFDWRRYTDRIQPSATAGSGRGLAMIGAYAKRVSFNRKGNQIKVDIARQRAGRVTL
jgi:anti-sigma regulatory factor (Ser/Thr protein kinase)